MTATALHARLLAGGCTASVGGGELLVSPAPPEPLEPALRILHTGVRAMAAGKTWYGSTGELRKKKRIVELNPTKLVPFDIDLLCVEGDAEWDRAPQWLRLDHPELFEQERQK